MTYYLEYLKDSVGNNYIGINIYKDTVSPFLDRLKNILEGEYDTYVKNQQNRDHGHYHITVINVMDYNRLSKEMGIDKFINSLESCFDYEIDDLKLMGLGTAQKNDNRAYFIVVNSDKLNQIRERFNLPPHDFHITLGFKWKDVFGVRKNEVIKEIDPFLKLLKKHYYNQDETFDFIKQIPNFEGDREKDIEPIEISDTTFTFRCGHNQYYTISLLSPDGIRVVANWQDNTEKPILSNYLINKKFKDV